MRGNPVAAPSAGLGSNSNYFFDSNCQNLTGLSVTINVTQDITAVTASASRSTPTPPVATSMAPSNI